MKCISLHNVQCKTDVSVVIISENIKQVTTNWGYLKLSK